MADVSWLESLLGPVLVKALPSLAWLLVVVVAGAVAVASVRRKLLAGGSESGFRAGNRQSKMGESGRGDWENMLASYKNLRDEGVLSEEEFRKVRTLVDPRMRAGVPELHARHRPPTDPAGPEAARE